MFLLLVLASLMVVSTSMVILAILKDKKLKTVQNLLVVNLLVSDLLYIFVHFISTTYLTSIYLFNLEWNDYCYVFILILLSLSRVITLMVIPMVVYRVISILYPFSYKRIITKSRILLQ